jgi:hypothetical protein
MRDAVEILQHPGAPSASSPRRTSRSSHAPGSNLMNAPVSDPRSVSTDQRVLSPLVIAARVAGRSRSACARDRGFWAP